MALRYPPRGASFPAPGETPRPIVGLDIDGTLGAYHEHFHSFAEGYLGRSLPRPEEFTGEKKFWQHLGLSRATYRKIKLAYRRGGLKRSMPVFDGASELSQSLRRRGAEVILCTTRPYLSLENVDEDTRHWTRRNKVVHDSIIWGERKYQELARLGRDRVVAVLEDEPLLVKQAQAAGLTAVMRDRPYNLHVTITHELAAAQNLQDASEILHTLLDEWEERQKCDS
jgi:phosphoglycolate phosphatase-like HAD superfamily hydrolase